MAKSSFFSGTGTNSTDVESITSSKAAAEAAAANAADSETNAAASESSAATSAINASVSASSASTSAANASVSATGASTSATSASTSATAAASSATAAAASETAAAASETAAAASETAAGTSETNAATSETNAATSATSAATSATTASTGATTATTKAAEASTSATNAATSATNAATSETNAATSATNAATSETNAATSASSASTSATNAASSASSAASAQTAAESARDATLTAYDNFDDRYLGAKTSDPSVDNDGNALVAGALYFDSTAGAMKVYTGSAWVAAYVSGTSYLPLVGGTLTGTLNFGDNVKAQFGASADLAIFHDGSNSYIQEFGTGNLILGAGNAFEVRSSDNVTTGAVFNAYGSVDLNHNGSTKLSTTSTGIDVTGTVVADGAAIGESTANTTVTVGGSYANGIELAQNGIDATSSARLFFDSTTDTSAIYNSGGDLTIAKAATVGSSSGNKSMTLGSNGDISFYEDTGTTAKLTWDATNEELEFGDNVKATFGASSDLQIYHDGSNSYISDQGQGVLYIQGSNNVQIESATGENMAVFLADNAVELYYDNTKRLETNASGVKVYDRLNVDLLQSSAHGSGSELDFDDDVDPFGTGQANFTTLRSIGGLNLVFDTNDNDSNGFFIGQNASDTSLADTHFNINGDGDAKFFSTNSGTAKLTWDASDDALRFASGAFVELNGWTITESGGSLYFATGGTNKMKLDASGNLDVVGSVNANATIT